MNMQFRANDNPRFCEPLSAGKVPNDILARLLARFSFEDPSVLINPGIGEDTAAADVSAEEVLVLKSDPITFATDSIGRYAVVVNANDIATAGAVPRWLLTTLLFPPGITGSQIWRIMHDLEQTCRRWSITLCGGHTEITDAVTRPVVIGMLAGTVARNELIDKRHMAVGDKILFTKAVAVEGTSIIAREFGARLAQLGIAAPEIERARAFLDHISIQTEARIARQSGTVSAMHDVTEGGLATALCEFGIAGNCRLRVAVDRIPVFDETRHICRVLSLDPLGLIGSGSLLIGCRAGSCDAIMAALRNAGISVACIGEAIDGPVGIEAVNASGPVAWPAFEVDEITRLYGG